MKINVNTIARKVEVDNRIPLRYYYRIADNLLKQADVYRVEKNIVDLYIILLRYSSLVSETIPFHRDYKALSAKEKGYYKKRLLAVVDELESLKPEFNRRVDELNRAHAQSKVLQLEDQDRSSHGTITSSSSEWPAVSRPADAATQSSWKYNNHNSQVKSASMAQFEKQFNKLSINLPPNKDTLSRHSILGPNGLRGQWHAPSTEIKVQYPSNMGLISAENSSLNQAGQFGKLALKDGDPGGITPTMESVLSLDDGRWSHPAEELSPPLINEASDDPFQFISIKQPLPPPVLAEVHRNPAPIPPSRVADPRPGPAQDGPPSTNTFQHLHVPVNMMENFLRLARANTEKNLETCGVLAGSLKNKVFHITTLIIPKQENTPDTCSTLNEEEIFEVQDRLSLFPLGWIHTHPTQSCFMSSVDLHTHYSYQIMLPEAVAIVMAPTDSSSPHGIFHLSDPAGVSVIRHCQQRGFHPHEEPSDGSAIYEHCSHVYMNPRLKFEVIDLR